MAQQANQANNLLAHLRDRLAARRQAMVDGDIPAAPAAAAPLHNWVHQAAINRNRRDNDPAHQALRKMLQDRNANGNAVPANVQQIQAAQPAVAAPAAANANAAAPAAPQMDAALLAMLGGNAQPAAPVAANANAQPVVAVAVPNAAAPAVPNAPVMDAALLARLNAPAPAAQPAMVIGRRQPQQPAVVRPQQPVVARVVNPNANAVQVAVANNPQPQVGVQRPLAQNLIQNAQRMHAGQPMPARPVVARPAAPARPAPVRPVAGVNPQPVVFQAPVAVVARPVVQPAVQARVETRQEKIARLRKAGGL